MDRYADVSFWLETAGDLAPRPPLDGAAGCDVAILGAGYTGLWTAYYLLKREPGLRIVIAESEIAGFGASGRNGAWCAPDLNISMERLARLHGEDAARRIQQATYDAVDEVGRVAAAEGIDAGFHRRRADRGPRPTASRRSGRPRGTRGSASASTTASSTPPGWPRVGSRGRGRPLVGQRGDRPPGAPGPRLAALVERMGRIVGGHPCRAAPQTAGRRR
jgi:glycine/D-amino acid oxidase-like deaminating enzyme